MHLNDSEDRYAKKVRPQHNLGRMLAGALAAFLLAYSLLSKLFPIVSIWETRGAGEEASATETACSAPLKPAPVVISLALLLSIMATPVPIKAGTDQKPAPKQAVVSLEYSVEASEPPASSVHPTDSPVMAGTALALENPFAGQHPPAHQIKVPSVLLRQQCETQLAHRLPSNR